MITPLDTQDAHALLGDAAPQNMWTQLVPVQLITHSIISSHLVWSHVIIDVLELKEPLRVYLGHTAFLFFSFSTDRKLKI